MMMLKRKGERLEIEEEGGKERRSMIKAGTEAVREHAVIVAYESGCPGCGLSESHTTCEALATSVGWQVEYLEHEVLGLFEDQREERNEVQSVSTSEGKDGEEGGKSSSTNALVRLLLCSVKAVERGFLRGEVCTFGSNIVKARESCFNRWKPLAETILKHDSVKRLWPEEWDSERLSLLLWTLKTFSVIKLGRILMFDWMTKCQHSCVPNAIISVINEDLIVRTIKDIPETASLSVDLCGDLAFEPTRTRLAVLESCFGLSCECDACTKLPDRARAFLCPRESRVWSQDETPKERLEHFVCPIAQGKKHVDWKCLTCGYQLEEKDVTRCILQEKLVEESPPGDFEEVEKILSSGILRREHYVIFHSVIKLAQKHFSQLQQNKVHSPMYLSQVEKLCQGLLDCADFLCPDPHPTKIDLMKYLLQAKQGLQGDSQAISVASRLQRESAILGLTCNSVIL